MSIRSTLAYTVRLVIVQTALSLARVRVRLLTLPTRRLHLAFPGLNLSSDATTEVDHLSLATTRISTLPYSKKHVRRSGRTNAVRVRRDRTREERRRQSRFLAPGKPRPRPPRPARTGPGLPARPRGSPLPLTGMFAKSISPVTLTSHTNHRYILAPPVFISIPTFSPSSTRAPRSHPFSR